ncbi:ribonuclease Y [Spiractinospora alimapuensis]|nr:ribonuclease Y [Spiractinospora alimapuensis]
MSRQSSGLSAPATAELTGREERVAEREAVLEEGMRRLAAEGRLIEDRSTRLRAREEELSRLTEEHRGALESVAGLRRDEARERLLAEARTEATREAAVVARRIEGEARTEAERRARHIVAVAAQRMAVEQTTESVVTTVRLPHDDMKGRIIGREGRNIRSFEAVTGVNVIVDETPEEVRLSCFDPVRREVARRTLEGLIVDGRIHPSRIEELFEASGREVEESCALAGRDALVETGVDDVAPELASLLGRLRYRTSFGQNVLAHLVESAHAAGLMADELGVSRRVSVRAALLHDIGKALPHDAAGSHALAGAAVVRRLGEDEAVVHAIEAHHNEVEVRSPEALLVQAADAMSGGRPGARRDSAEVYVRRLRRLEELALSSPGTTEAFAMRAGREVRVLVTPDEVDDVQAQVIARDIAKRVEEENNHTGQVRITVVRESRAIEIVR